MFDIDSRFTVKQLKAMCTALGLPVSGTKGPLQARLRACFDSLITRNDTARYNIGKTAAEKERNHTYRSRY